MNTLTSQLWSHMQQPDFGLGMQPHGDFSLERSDYCETQPFKGSTETI